MKALDAERLDLAFRAAELKAKLDQALEDTQFRLQWAFVGSWAYLQAAPVEGGPEAVTLFKVRKGGAMRWLLDTEEAGRPVRAERKACHGCSQEFPLTMAACPGCGAVAA